MALLEMPEFTENAERDLSKAEKNELRKLMPVLVSTCKGRRKGTK
jgi:hypothetical protein